MLMLVECMYLHELLLGVVAPPSGCLSACICMCLSELLGAVAPHSGCLSACITRYGSTLYIGIA